jgi:GntR family transcriptional regulator, transcriptional repressor for pyruvate dehydrogenase complex
MRTTTLTERGIRKIRGLIESGHLQPGSKLPPEPELASLIGTSRNTAREAVSALTSARVLDVRRGDGTYVTSLSPRLLLEGFGLAIDLLQEDRMTEIFELRRLLEPAATRMAATRIDGDRVAQLREQLDLMRASLGHSDDLVDHDVRFHELVADASGNQTLASMLAGISRKTIHARVWRGLIESGADQTTVEQHARILDAIERHDGQLAEAIALVHVSATQSWFEHASSSSLLDASSTRPNGKRRSGRR